MAPPPYFGFRKVLLLYLVLFLFSSVLICACSETHPQSRRFLARRRLLELEKEDKPKKKTTTTTTTTTVSTKNQTKLIKPKTNSTKSTPTLLTKTQLQKQLNSTSKTSNSITKTTPTSFSIKAQLKKLNSTSKASNSTKTTQNLSIKSQLKKLNSTSKASNSTKPSSIIKNKSSDPLKLSTLKNKTTKPAVLKQSPESKNPDKNQVKDKKFNPQKTQKPSQPSWLDQDEEDDLVAGFRDLPSKFQQSLLPDLEKFSTTSKAYLTKANKEITRGFKPIVGNKYASTIASFISFAFILIPLLLVSLLFNRIKAYFSLQKILIFIQVYLSIYFSILCLSSLVTGLEPLRFFYASSRSTYVGLQVLQTLGYVLYLLLLLMYLVLVFSTDCGLGSKMLGLGQTFVGFAVGLHYYVSVFHRAVLQQPPKTNWKVHGIYAACFFVICLFATAERRKKTYLEDGGEEGKKN
ncbi:hypothetical protein L1049_002526 [Liquidambar formosana]|uniref:Uncharacterized protein n=1 Tax=Liquidambar formosana TaxID=63359 RepID=A0AAP0NFX1_LIQFO